MRFNPTGFLRRQALKTWPVPKHSDLQLMLGDAEPDSDHPMWLSEKAWDFNIFHHISTINPCGLYWFILVYIGLYWIILVYIGL
jgi:hypothetical protein